MNSMNRTAKIIFSLSLLINLLLLGAGAGMLYRFVKDVPIPGDMSPEARHFVARTFQQGRDEVKPLITEIKAERRKVEDVLTAPEFDSEAYEKAVGEMLETRGKITALRAEIMGRALADLPAEDRQKFAKRILDSLEGRSPKRGGYHKKMMDRDAAGK